MQSQTRQVGESQSELTTHNPDSKKAKMIQSSDVTIDQLRKQAISGTSIANQCSQKVLHKE